MDEASHAQMRQACSVPVATAAALMPDAHVGYGLPIGGVLACDNAVIPYAVGVDIVRHALEAPARQIADNAGARGEVVIDQVKGMKKGEGFDALKGEYGDMFERGIVDAAKVTRSALQNAASIAAMVLTTETLVTDLPEKKENGAGGGHGHGGDMDF